MEYLQGNIVASLTMKPSDHECEKASNSYIMSLVAVIVGLPFPIINLIATFIFYISNRKGTLFVRWHCTQALLSQASLLLINTIAFWWTISVAFRDGELTNDYIAYIISVIIFNLIELVATIYTAIQVRKGRHVKWYFYGDLVDRLVKN